MKGLDSTKFLEILHSNKTPNKFSNHQLKVAFKHPNFVHKAILNLFENTHPPGFETLEFQNFFCLFYIISTQTIYVNQKLHTLSRFATLRAISNLFSFFLYTLRQRGKHKRKAMTITCLLY